jgi:hypothetical protein
MIPSLCCLALLFHLFNFAVAILAHLLNNMSSQLIGYLDCVKHMIVTKISSTKSINESKQNWAMQCPGTVLVLPMEYIT